MPLDVEWLAAKSSDCGALRRVAARLVRGWKTRRLIFMNSNLHSILAPGADDGMSLEGCQALGYADATDFRDDR